MSNPILAIDASNLICRAFTSRPDHTFASLQDDLRNRVHQARTRVHARAVVSALDAPVNWRARIYGQYKDGRSPKPPLLREALNRAEELMRAAGTRPYSGEHLEADDVLATMAHKNPGRTVIMTTDRDLYAAVNERVQILDIKRRLLGPLEVQTQLGVPPERVPLFKALAGDGSDNIPGVAMIGVKSAPLVCMTAVTPDDAILEALRNRYPKHINARILASQDDLRRWYELTCLRIGVIQELKA
ncbi:5'-3' exonuclease [Deinococcus navajonensis]|uniref:5-3 exonuclease n=1 Tax=Deinococcus navajonensis TaxID=309884 RepID=A0ABV8XJ44_9DEIO